MKTDEPIDSLGSSGAEAFRALTGGPRLAGRYRFQSLTALFKPLHRLPRRIAVLDWRLLAAAGAGGGLLLGLAAAGLGGWPLAWLALLAGLTWLGWDPDPRLAAPLPEPPRPAGTPAAPRLVREQADGIELDMVALPGGRFWMGSPDADDMADDNEKSRHEVQVSALRLGRTPVTVALYHLVLNRPEPPPEQAALPMTDLSWEDAVVFCNALSRRHGYRPCYRRRGLWRWRHWHCDWRADGYRLPTEAEWEYACRAGTATRYSFGDDPARLGDYAWHAGNSDYNLHPVAKKRPNPWGLYDMHGNCWEWCWDWYDRYQPPATGPAIDPHGPPRGERRGRVLRGGSYWGPPGDLRAAGRVVIVPAFRFRVGGFRCARVASPQH